MTLLLPDLSARTVQAVLDAALQSCPDKPALTGPDGTVSYAGLHETATRMASSLRRLGVRRQDPVLLMLDNHQDFVATWIAVSYAAAVEVPVNTAYLGDILSYVVNDSAARIMVVDAGYCDRLAAVAPRLTTLETVIVRGGDAASLVSTGLTVVAFEELLDSTSGLVEPVDPWDLIGYMYTSGTTGPSKGVRVTHAHAYGYCSPAVTGGCDEHDVNMVTLPLFHIGGQWAGVYNALIAQATAAVLPGFHATTFWEEVREYGCTFTLLLGAVANFLYRQPRTERDAENPMRRAVMVPVIDEVHDFAERFGVQIGTAYGLTEGSTPIRTPFGEAVPGACGTVRPDFDARLVDERDLDVPVGKVGELVIRPHEPWTVMDGYHGKPEATIAAWRNLWLHTGDAFYQDDKGRFCFVDRLKDAIRRRGENVSSFEVESAINKHPSVLESAVVGVSSEHTEEEIKAVVVLQPETTLSESELILFLRGRLPYFMIPRFIELRSELPKTPTQKIRKDVLRAAGVSADTWDAESAGLGPRRSR